MRIVEQLKLFGPTERSRSEKPKKTTTNKDRCL